MRAISMRSVSILADVTTKRHLPGLGVCAAERIPTAKAPQRSIYPIFFVT